MAFAELLPALKDIAGGEVVEKALIKGKETQVTKSARVADRLKAYDLLGKYGGVAELSLTFEEQPEVVLSSEELRDRKALLLERIQRINRVEDLEKLMVSIAKEQVAIDA